MCRLNMAYAISINELYHTFAKKKIWLNSDAHTQTHTNEHAQTHGQYNSVGKKIKTIETGNQIKSESNVNQNVLLHKQLVC